MKSLIFQSVCFSVLVAVSGGQVAMAQGEDVQSIVKNVLPPAVNDSVDKDSVSEELANDDIPPPVPVPETSVPAQQRQSAEGSIDSRPVPRGGEVRAYDFGISYVSTDQGLQVKGVVIGSLAAASGVRPNDMIVAVNGNPVDDDALIRDPVETLELIRSGVRESLTVASSAQRRANYVPKNQSAYTVPEGSTAPPATAPRVPSRTYGQAPVYRYAPGTVYRTQPYSSRSYYYGAGRPRISIGYGAAIGSGYGPYRGYRYSPGMRYGGYGGYGRGVGVGYGRGYGRSGISISFGF
jgi:hypothetical protein